MNAVAHFVDRQSALSDRELGFRHRVGFNQRAALHCNVRHGVPSERFALVLAAGVFYIAKLHSVT